MGIEAIRTQRLLGLLGDRTEPVVVIEALAGMGKSRLLDKLKSAEGVSPDTRAGSLFWDVPSEGPSDRLDSATLSSRLMLARRPHVQVPGLDRFFAFGEAYRLPEEALLYQTDELIAAFGEKAGQEIASKTGGWPLLVDDNGQRWVDPDVLGRFIADEILAHLPDETLIRLAMMSAGISVAGGTPPLPLARLDPSGAWVIGGLEFAAPLAAALATEQNRRLTNPSLCPLLAAASARLGFARQTILSMQKVRAFEAAERLLEAEHGWYFLYFHGATAFDEVLAGFPEEASRQSDTVVFCRALQALKHGEVSLARRLLADRFGSETRLTQPRCSLSAGAIQRNFEAFAW